jgi:protein O-mannosyl-transferase
MTGSPGRWTAPCLLAAVTLAVWSVVLANGFVYDDGYAIVGNPLLHSLRNSAHIWVSSYWPVGLLYRPLTVQLFALEWWLGGGAPLVFHAANLILYAAVCALVYLIARRVAPAGALAAGLLFAVHPVHVEAVANGVGQSELLAALFMLLAVERYQAWRVTGFGVSRRVALGVLYLLAIASKETGYVLPLLLLAVEGFTPDPAVRRRPQVREQAALLALLIGVALIGLLVRLLVLGGFRGEVALVPLRGLGVRERMVAMFAVIPHWFRLLLWPLHLQAHYGPPGLPVSTTPGTAQLLGIGLFAAAAAALAWSARRAPAVALGLAWTLVTLLPVSNLFAATGILLAERTLLLPSVGVALGASWCVARLIEATRLRPAARVALVSGLGLLLLPGGWRSVQRSRVWKDDATFMAQLQRDAPDSYRAQLTAGIWYLGERRFPEAERSLARARELYRQDPAVYETYGQLYRIQRRCDLALPIFSEGLALHPTATTLRSRLIECALAEGDTTRARAVAEQAVQLGLDGFQATLRRLEP